MLKVYWISHPVQNPGRSPHTRMIGAAEYCETAAVHSHTISLRFEEHKLFCSCRVAQQIEYFWSSYRLARSPVARQDRHPALVHISTSLQDHQSEWKTECILLRLIPACRSL